MIPCEDYDASQNKCKAGHIQLTGLCRGVVPNHCNSCGYSSVLPQCLKEEPPTHLVREDGLPLGWDSMNPLNNWKFSLPLGLILLSYGLLTPDWFAMFMGFWLIGYLF